jgi:hypothetical protein
VFNPLEHFGLPVDHHGRHWHELDVEPVDVQETGAYTRCRISTIEGLQAAATRFDLGLARRCQDTDTRRRVGSLGESASGRRSNVAALQPRSGGELERAVGYERAALDLVTWVARSEPDAGRAQAYGGQALQHLGRLYGYADLCDRAGYRWAGRTVGYVGDLMSAPAAPAVSGHGDRPAPAAAPSPQSYPVSLLHRWLVGAVEQQVAGSFTDVLAGTGPSAGDQPLRDDASGSRAGRDRYRDADQDSWERLVVHESAACYLYYCFLTQETDRQVKAIWELHLQMELAHLQAAADLLRRSRGADPQEVVGDGLPEPIAFESNGPFLRSLLFTDAGPARGDTRPRRRRSRRPAGRYRSRPDGERDIVDLLTAQHARINRQFQRVADATGDDRHAALGELALLLAVHEIIEEEAVHPLTRRLDPEGHVADRMLDEEHRISDALSDVVRADSADDRDGSVGALRDMVRAHARDEERYEFARLRRAVPRPQLREMARAVGVAEAAAAADGGGQARRTGPAELRDLPGTVERVRDALRTLSRDLLV